MKAWLIGAIFLAVALISLLPASWAVWVFFGVVGIALIIYGIISKQ